MVGSESFRPDSPPEQVHRIASAATLPAGLGTALGGLRTVTLSARQLNHPATTLRRLPL